MDRDTTIAAKTALPRTGNFWRNEDGTILFFAVCMMLVMFMLAGMGVDIMRYETVRTELQQTLDRSTLASASLTQELNPEDVVRDYFEKAGLSEKLTSVQVTNGVNFRTVRAEARASTHPIFLRLYGGRAVDDIEARGVSVAEQRISNVEISLVLDVSGSMAGDKITNLKTSAKEFIDTVLDSDGENKISISIIPYNGQVNLQQNMQDIFSNRVDDHNKANVNCFDLPSSVYGGLGLSITDALPVTAFVDTYSSSSYTSSYVTASSTSAIPNPANRWCPDMTNNMVLPPTNNKTKLKTHIDGLVAMGATSINAGMKWGMALLDPGSRPIITDMIGKGATPTYFEGRPYAYRADDSMKVVVLMTDGEHFPEERVNAGYRAGNSKIYRSSGDGNYSRYQDRSGTSNDYWVPHRTEWRSSPWNSGAGVTEQTWPQMWERQRMTWVAWQLYARANGSSSSAFYAAMDQFRSKTATSDMDNQLQTVCDRARDNNVIVYGIAFQAPANGAAQIEKCSSTPGHFFNAEGLEIQSAFRAIASNISQLRLTQ